MTPVQYSVGSKTLVDAFEALPEDQQLGSYWSDKAIDSIRAEVKDHYIVEQQYRCVYCNRQIVTANKALWDAEHIISRSRAARFMFRPQNLAVSCRDCNNAKGEKEVRVDPARVSFPDRSNHYVIVHPHYDDYDIHIRWFGDICVPQSEKGERTQSVCRLTRFTAALLGIEGGIDDSGFDELVGQLVKAKTRTRAKALLAAMNVYAETLPQE